MSELKISQHPWHIDNDNNKCQLVITNSDESKAVAFLPELSEESMSNAQLIANAPQMYDFIRRICGELLRNDFILDERWQEQGSQIINNIKNQ